MKYIFLTFFTLYTVTNSLAQGNTWNVSFTRAKHILQSDVYTHKKLRITIYCQAIFDTTNTVTLPEGFTTKKYRNRIHSIEWEHVVPAEHFGRNFIAWYEGDNLCMTSSGEKYKGRRCAEKASKEYAYMQADMYNLYPAIGAVNALRSNYDFCILDNAKSDFGMCLMKIDQKRAEPPCEARGKIARAYLYMDNAYEKYSMDEAQHALMHLWHSTYPVTQDECTRTKNIEQIQGNENIYVKEQCIDLKMW